MAREDERDAERVDGAKPPPEDDGSDETPDESNDRDDADDVLARPNDDSDGWAGWDQSDGA